MQQSRVEEGSSEVKLLYMTDSEWAAQAPQTRWLLMHRHRHRLRRNKDGDIFPVRHIAFGNVTSVDNVGAQLEHWNLHMM